MPKILLVDDAEEDYEALLVRLKRRGYEAVLATDGQQAVDMVSSEHPDLVLMDLQLPVLNGLEATHKIRGLPEGKELPIIAITAHATTYGKEMAETAGCNDYHAKPVSFPQLLRQIDDLLGTKSAD